MLAHCLAFLFDATSGSFWGRFSRPIEALWFGTRFALTNYITLPLSGDDAGNLQSFWSLPSFLVEDTSLGVEVLRPSAPSSNVHVCSVWIAKEKTMAAPSNEASISLRVAGAWSGEVVVQLSTCRLPELRTKIAEASGFDEEGMKLICGGRMLKDDGGDKVLSQLGVTEKSKLLVTKVSAAQVQGMAAEAENARLMEERTQRLGRLK